MKKLALALLTTAIALSGCASFKKNEVAHIDKLPDVSQYRNKPSVYIDFRFFRGEPGSTGAPEISMAHDHLKPQIEKALADSQLFSNVSFDESMKKQSDYTLKLHVYNHGSTGAAAVAGFLCGFTFGVIPAAATDNYTLLADVSKPDGASTKVQNKDAITTWMGIWLIPAMGNTPAAAINDTITNQLRDVLKRLVDGGNIQYSWLFDVQQHQG